MTSAIARSSAASGRLSRKPRYAAPWAHSVISSASSACTTMREPIRATSAIASASSAGARWGNSSTPESSRKHLKPKTPASWRGARSATLPGTAPPQKPTSTQAWSAATARFASSAATVVVGGMLLSGMSTIVVTPPAAAARVALAKPSQSVRPGSLTWTWVSTSPGSSTSSSASTTTSAPAASASYAPIATTTPSRSRTETDRSAPSTTARPARTRVSAAVCSAMLSCLGRSSSRTGSAAAGRGSARRARRRR